ncbi:hypothetical protein ABBQ38_012216 [Trebouxia sp. C0009 RCD-2024]
MPARFAAAVNSKPESDHKTGLACGGHTHEIQPGMGSGAASDSEAIRALDQLYAGKAGQGDIHLAPVMFCNSRATPGTAQATWASTSITTVLDFTRVLHHCCRPQQQWSSALGKFRMVLWCLNLVKFVHRFWTPEHQCMQQELSLGMFAGVFVSKQAEGGCWIQSAASSNNKQEHRLARTRCGLRLRRTHARHTA